MGKQNAGEPNRENELEGAFFRAGFSPTEGGMNELYIQNDPSGMNWVKEGNVFFRPVFDRPDEAQNRFAGLGGQMTGSVWCARYRSRDLSVEITYRMEKNGFLTAEICYTNESSQDLYFYKGLLGLTLPFCDSYCDADTCMEARCHTHIWCGGSTGYVLALKMGESPHNVGVVLKEGFLECYSQIGVRTNDRGVFLLHPALPSLKPQESRRLSFQFFVCEGKEDFYGKLSGNFDLLLVSAKRYTVYENEPICFQVNRPDARVYCGTQEIPVNDGRVEFAAAAPGICDFRMDAGEKRTWARFFVASPLESLFDSRAFYLIRNQQCTDPESPRYGAYLIYDEQEQRMYCNAAFPDHNALRERVGSAIFLVKYARRHPDSKILQSLRQYEGFLRRQAIDLETGDVFNQEGREDSSRLYNFYWYAWFYLEYYELLKEKEFLDIALRILRRYYERGGIRHYPNAAMPYRFIRVLSDCGREEQAGELGTLLLQHAGQIMQNGTSYPKHEVDYEQSIVAPACMLLLDAYRYSGQKQYLTAAKEHIRILCRFEGEQPDCRQNGIAIRYWDDFWFGKNQRMGDVFPHYWSVLSGGVYVEYGELTGNLYWVERGKNIIRNNLILFGASGNASCACVYPWKVNGSKGEFLDPWANDQDFALCYAMDYL